MKHFTKHPACCHHVNMLLFLVLLFLVIGCNTCSNEDDVIHLFENAHNDIMPLSVGNKWYYATTVWGGWEGMTRIDSIVVTNMNVIDGEQWYSVFSSHSYDTLLMRNDRGGLALLIGKSQNRIIRYPVPDYQPYQSYARFFSKAKKKRMSKVNSKADTVALFEYLVETGKMYEGIGDSEYVAITTEYIIKDDSLKTCTESYAPGVGLVRFIEEYDGDDFRWAVESYLISYYLQ